MVRLKDYLGDHPFFAMKFQFLMVRLKGWNVGCVYFFCEISIPYGAIKRRAP